MHLSLTRDDPDTIADMHTVSILMQEGGSKDIIRADVVNNGKSLEVLCHWPKQLSNSIIANNRWLKDGSESALPTSNPRQVANERTPKKIRSHKQCKFKSVAVFDLPLTVRIDIYSFYKLKNSVQRGICALHV